jgi:hypothetical protein
LIALPFILVLVKNHVWLSRGVHMAGTTWQVVTRIMVGVGDMVWRTRDGEAQVEYSVTGRSGDRVIPCMVCTVHEETRSTGFLVKPQNQGP